MAVLKWLHDVVRKLPGRPDPLRPAVNSDPAAKPGTKNLNALGVLFGQRRFTEMETLALAETARNATHSNGWQALGIAVLYQGRPGEAVIPLQKAAELAPDDANTHRYLGIALHQHGRFTEAEASYHRALQLEPRLAEVLRNLGTILNDRGQFAEAEARCRQALALTPDDAKLHNVLGLAQMEQGRLTAAETSYRRALELKPDFAAAHNYLGIVLKAQGRFTEAEASCRQALALKPNLAAAHNILGTTLMEQGRFDEAAASFQRAVELDTNYAAAYGNLGNALRAQGKTAEALECYRRLLAIAPADEVARHWFSALSGSQIESAPREYVASVFDFYAKTFDAHLLGVLEYRTPEQIAALVTESWASSGEKRDVLDLGCGTGLVGVALAPHIRQLVGVDLSGNMLEQARARGVYTRLEKAELLDTMRSEQPASYDAIIAADVFVYVGRIDDICAEAKRLLRRGGVFGFSAEALDALQTTAADATAMRDVQLLPSGRFAHSSAYLQRLSLQYGFESLHFVPATMRLENRSPLRGWLVLWKA